MKYFPGWNKIDTIKPAPTIVVTPTTPNNAFTLDVSYVDHTTVFDVFDVNATEHPPCYIIPPYKPLMYVAGLSTNTLSIQLIHGTF